MKRKDFIKKAGINELAILAIITVIFTLLLDNNVSAMCNKSDKVWYGIDKEQESSSVKYVLIKSASHEDVVKKINQMDCNNTQEKANREKLFGNKKAVKSEGKILTDKNNVSTTTAFTENTKGCISVENGVSSAMYNSVMSYYQIIPYGLRSAIETNGWKIVISNKSLKERFKLSQSALAITEYQSKTIYIDNRISACKSVIHEVGHVVDFLNGSVSLTSSFYEVYISEKDIFTALWQTDSNNTATTIEYFAETFEASVINSQLMKDNCPNTYDYIAELTKQGYPQG